MRETPLLFLLLASACLPQFEEQIPVGNSSTALHVLAQPDFSWDLSEENSLVLSAGAKLASVKELSKLVALVISPKNEMLSTLPTAKQVPLGIKTLEKGRLFSLTPKKTKLSGGFYYGVYVREPDAQGWRLNHVFYAKHPKPLLLSHDLGEGALKAIPQDRINFLFEFDQPVHLPDDQAVTLVGKTAQAPAIASLTLHFEQKALKVSLDKSQKLFERGQNYGFHFNTILNQDNQVAQIAPVEFVVGAKAQALASMAAPRLDIGHDGAELSWHLNNGHRAEIYFGEDLKGLHDCLGSPCPRSVPSVSSRSSEGAHSHFDRIYLAGLKPDTGYHFVIRAEDHQGHIVVAGGAIKTRSQASLRFSEILINPKTQSGAREHVAEFIEFVYAGTKPQKIVDLKLVLQSLEGDQSHECPLASLDDPLVVEPGQYVVVVGQDFDEQSAAVPAGARLVRLSKKNLCGGLANEKAKIIKLMKEQGTMIDRFGAYLWKAPEGVSIRRQNPEGLDEANNYCYADVARGPTPGGPP